MKLSCRKHRRLSVMAAYHELPVKDQEWFESHLSECEECRMAHQGVRETLGTLSALDVPEEGRITRESYWTSLSARLQDREVPSRTGLVSRRRPSYRIVLATAAALLFVALGVVIGRLTFKETAPSSSVEQTASVLGPGDTLSTAQAEHASEYLDRSKVLILGIMNNKPASGFAFQASWARQQRVSRELINESRLLQEELNGPRQARLRLLVAQLEGILSQIADIDAETGVAGVEVVRSGLDEGAILFKINVEQMYLDDCLHPSGDRQQNEGI